MSDSAPAPFSFDSLITDPSLDEGVWLIFNGSLRCKIANANSPKFQRAMDRHRRRLGEHQIKKKPALAQECVNRAYADAVFLEFEGAVTLLGKTLHNSPESRYELLSKAAPFLHWVVNESNNIENFQKEARAEEAETLKSGSPVES